MDSQPFVYFVYVMGHCHTTDTASSHRKKVTNYFSKVYTTQFFFSPLEANPVFTTHCLLPKSQHVSYLFWPLSLLLQATSCKMYLLKDGFI